MRRGYLVFYDIRDPRRLREIRKIATAYGDMLQYSVYACLLTPARRVQLATRLRDAMDLRKDRVIILDMGQVRAGHDWIPPIEAFGNQYLPEARQVIIT